MQLFANVLYLNMSKDKTKTMITFTARFRGTNNKENLETFLAFGVKGASTTTIAGNSLFVSWICEDENTTEEDIMNEIDILRAEAFGIYLVSFFKS